MAQEFHRQFLFAEPLKYGLASLGCSPCAFPSFLKDPASTALKCEVQIHCHSEPRHSAMKGGTGRPAPLLDF